MRFLFVHQNFPGQYVHIVRHLTRELHDVVFLSEPNANQLPDVRKIAYVSPRASDERTHENAREFEMAVRRAEAAANAARQIKALGFVPDIIIGHHGWGELLNMQDVFPGTPLLGYFEFFYNLVGQDVNFDPEFPVPEHRLPMVRAKNAVNLAALSLPDAHGQTPTEWQRSTYPAWARPQIALLREGVDLEHCSPAAPRASRRFTLPDGFRLEPKHQLITFMSRNLEPYRGFHVFMRALPRLQVARPDLHVTLVGHDQPGYGALPADGTTWRETMMREMAGKLDLERVHFLGQVPYDTHVALMRRSDAHVYLSYPFVASWSLREAMAIGVAIVGSDTAPVREFITHEETGLLTPFLEPDRLADSILRLLDDPTLSRRLRRRARLHAEAHLDRRAHLDDFVRLIERLTNQPLPGRSRATLE
ncbi:MAG: glycosyltransferase [Proteobacteria bacterium]|nr:glycosyltransferase [Pseudomonadota bacterium]